MNPQYRSRRTRGAAAAITIHVIGRECTAAEKADLLSWLLTLTR